MPLVWHPDYQMLVDKESYLRGKHNQIAEKRSHLAAPNVIRDSMPEIKSMADGRRYDSKRAYERGVRRKGCEIVGFEKDWQRHYPDRKKLVDRALDAEVREDTNKAFEIEQSKVPSYGPEARRLMRKERRRRRESVC